jgi:hypothetical protein
MKVTNLNGTSDNTCSCGSWLKHWEKYNSAGSRIPSRCPACGKGTPDVGAHVQKYNSTDNAWYIVPLCYSCNKKTSSDVLDIGDCALAPANKSLTCGR